MPLFEDFSQVHEVLGAGNISNSIEQVNPFFEQAMDEYLKPIFGEDLAGELISISEAASPDAKESTALKLARRAIANLGYMLYSMDGGVIIDDTGFQRMENAQTKSVYQWQIINFRRQRELSGWNALRMLYQFCEKNISEAFLQTHYEQAEERIAMRSILVNDDLEVSKFIKISGFQTWWEMRGYFEQVQDNTLRSMITSDVLDALIIHRLNNDEGQEQELFRLSKAVVSYGALCRAIPLMMFKVEKGGLVITEFISNKDNVEQSTQAAEYISKMRVTAESNFAIAKDNLEQFMVKNVGDYPSYKEEILDPIIESETTLEQLREKNKRSKIVRL